MIFLQNKGETFNKFLVWYKQITNIFNLKIKYIKSDNGTEFTSSEFQNLCKQDGLIHLFSTPYTPQQNGRIERLNGVLINTGTALLEDSKLSKKFWKDAVSIASYLYNRISHSAINNKIPYEIIHKSKVNYKNLKIFGCKVLFLIPKQKQHKFENNAMPGIFIGYCKNPKAYKIFDITNNKIVISRVVEFFENTSGDFYFDKQINDINDQTYNIQYSQFKNNFNPTYNNQLPLNLDTTNTFNVDNKNYNIYKNNQNQDKSHTTNTTMEIDSNNNNQNNINELAHNTNRQQNNNVNLNLINNQNNNKGKYSNATTNKKSTKTKKFKPNESNNNNNKNNFENILREPLNYKDIFNLKDKEEWISAVKEEINNMNRLKVYQIVKDLPRNANLVSSR